MHKLVPQYIHSAIAQKVLFELWESFDVVSLDDDFLEDAIALVTSTSAWKGKLQEASIIITARHLGLNIWILDYRDFSQFDDF